MVNLKQRASDLHLSLHSSLDAVLETGLLVDGLKKSDVPRLREGRLKRGVEVLPADWAVSPCRTPLSALGS